jgi:ribose-phosphate pyrophosphokinase
MTVKPPILQASKTRDAKGDVKITLDTSLVETNENSILYVIDDICDGGRTFIELANVIKLAGVKYKSLNLFVTHGFFTHNALLRLRETYDR